MKINETNEDVLPLLVNFSVLRTGDDSLPGYYDDNKQVWVVEGNHGVEPIGEAAGGLAELSTKTFAEPERDDPESMMFLEASTKTEAKPERDDVTEPSLMALLQLATKTRAQLERDD